MAENSDQPAPTLRLSTEDFPQQDRLAAIREYVGRKRHSPRYRAEGCGGTTALLGPGPFRAGRGLGNLSYFTGHLYAHPATVGRRMRRHPGGGDIERHDDTTGQQADLEAPPGAAVLLSMARAQRYVYHGAAKSWVLRLPHRALADMVPRFEEAPTSVIPQETPALSLLLGYAQLLENDALATPAIQEMTGRHPQEMAALVIGSSPDQEHVKSGAAARLRTIKAYIGANRGNPNLNLAAVAAWHGVTPRYVQILFERQGTSFTAALRKSRLAQAMRLLRDPRTENRSILSIALECGFSEASALNRAFRQHYEITPTDARMHR